MIPKASERLEKAQRRHMRVYNLRKRPAQYNPWDRVWRNNKILSDALNYTTANQNYTFVEQFTVKKIVSSKAGPIRDK